jgi:hypothetical protein
MRGDKIFIGILLEKPGRRIDDGSNVGFQALGYINVYWIQLAQSKDQWQPLLDTTTQLAASYKTDDFLTR